MELKQLKYFIEIADQEHMTEAALSLDIAQSALSRQMSMLEAELGVKLFRRAGRNIKLTDEGALFLKEASDILEAVEKSKEKLSDEMDKHRETMNIRMVKTDMTGKVMQSLTQFTKQEALAHFTIDSVDEENITQELEEGNTDIALSPVKVAGQGMKSVLLFEQNYRYVFRESSTVSLPRNARMNEITGYPLATINPLLNIKEMFSSEDITNFDDLTIIQHLLMSHDYVAIVSPEEARLLKYNYPGFVDYSLGHLNVSQPVYLSMKENNKKTFVGKWFNNLRQEFGFGEGGIGLW